jgi:hypothetical protein
MFKNLLLVSGAVYGLEPASSFDCPNSSWQFVANANGNYCIPKDVTVKKITF